MTAPRCSICKRNPAPVRVRVDGRDVFWCGQCITDRINTTRGILKTSTGAAVSGATWAERVGR